MRKIILTFLSFQIALSIVKAQKVISFNKDYAAGNKMLMNVDSAAKNVFYANVFQNQPNTSFNFLPEVNNVSIQIYFRKTDSPERYRYTIMEDGETIVVNKLIDISQLKDVNRGDKEIFRSTTFGIFPIKDKIITIVTYDIKKPQEVYKTIFYGKPIPRAKIQGFTKRFNNNLGVSYTNIPEPKENTKIIFAQEDDELTIVKNRSDLDYLYRTSIKDKQTDKIIFESTSWQYGGYLDKNREFSPYIKIDRNVFKKAGEYEIIIQPLFRGSNPPEDIEKYTSRNTLSITLDTVSYTKKELLLFTLAVAFSLALAFLTILFFIKKRNRKILAEKEQQKTTAKLKLNSIRSQLNPHFLFNALSGIQNLMNKNEIDNANKYLSKFARLTRNVLDDQELISLAQEKTLLDDYLQMEQLRFGFNYEINTPEDLDLNNIEIPSMLLQPFVENAVKHGISQKANDGKISISFMKQASDLVLTVVDNGKGFDIEKKHSGLGLSLSNSRIELLNSIYKENRFTLATDSNTEGTKIRLTITDWL